MFWLLNEFSLGDIGLLSISIVLILLLFFVSEVYNVIFFKGIIDSEDCYYNFYNYCNFYNWVFFIKYLCNYVGFESNVDFEGVWWVVLLDFCYLVEYLIYMWVFLVFKSEENWDI